MFFLTAKRNVESKYWQRYIARYNGLEMSDQARQLLTTRPWAFKAMTNGVGSQVGFWNKVLMVLWLPIFRNCLFFLNITKSSDIHDVEYGLHLAFKTIAEGLMFKQQTDLRFLNNMFILIYRAAQPPRWAKYIPGNKRIWKAITECRKIKADVYYIAVKEEGETSFWAGKIKPQS